MAIVRAFLVFLLILVFVAALIAESKGAIVSQLLYIWEFWKSHGTRILGFAQGTIAALCGVAGIIPDNHLKYWLAASAVMTFWRGFTNSRQ